jgi:hypothetical protein
MATKVVETKTELHQPKPIKPTAMKIHDQTGHCFRSFVIEMPEDVTLDDIGNHPELWTSVQADRTGRALVEDDKVEIRWQDKRVYAVVDYADANGVTFCDIRKVTKRNRDREPFNDGTYAIRWTSGGFTYFRVSDGVRMSSVSYSTADAAKAALLREQYPAKVA